MAVAFERCPQSKTMLQQFIRPGSVANGVYFTPSRHMVGVFHWPNSLCTYTYTSHHFPIVRLIPKVIYHEADFLAPGSTAPFLRTNRGPFTTLTLPIFLGAGLTRLGTRTAALFTQQAGYQSLCKSIDEVIQHLESSVSSLEASLDSLVEVVLQSRGGQICYFFSRRAYA